MTVDPEPHEPPSPWNRTVGILLRAAHLFTMAVYVGGVWWGASGPALEWWRALAFVSGFGLLATEVTHGHGWISQARGLGTVAHVLALAMIGWGAPRTGTTLAVVVGALGSHAPKWIRMWSLRDGRAVD